MAYLQSPDGRRILVHDMDCVHRYRQKHTDEKNESYAQCKRSPSDNSRGSPRNVFKWVEFDSLREAT